MERGNLILLRPGERSMYLHVDDCIVMAANVAPGDQVVMDLPAGDCMEEVTNYLEIVDSLCPIAARPAHLRAIVCDVFSNELVTIPLRKQALLHEATTVSLEAWRVDVDAVATISGVCIWAANRRKGSILYTGVRLQTCFRLKRSS
jgi:hypothetical protein